MTRTIFALIAAIATLCGCSSKPASQAEGSSTATDSTTLVLYYSQTGSTKAIAQELQRQLSCDIAAIEAVNPYDGDYDATIKRWRSELQDSVKVPIKPLDIDLGKYDTIFLGFPIWGGAAASPVTTFFEDNDLKGKTIVTFATFGSGGLESATEKIASAQPNATVIAGYGIRNARIDKAPAEITRFLIENKYISGEIEPLPDYSEARPVNDSDKDIFNAACGSYKFPLGTPVSVATRTTPDGTDYKFDVSTSTPQGEQVSATIFVSVSNGSSPEFTKMVR